MLDCIGTVIPDNISKVKRWKNKRFINYFKCFSSQFIFEVSQAVNEHIYFTRNVTDMFVPLAVV